MKALIVGLGSIGRRHLANLRAIEPRAEITIWHQHSKNEGDVIPSGADHVVYRLEDALSSQPDVAIISSPAVLHVQTGLTLAQAGINLLIEKPISNKVDGVSELISLCRNRGLVLMVGYNLRFYEPLQLVRQVLREGQIGRIMSIRAEVGQYLPEWRPGSDYRQNVSARRDLGGGVVFELSHELDYVRWLVGEVKTVSAQVGRLSDLEIDVEDTAEIVLQFNNGAIGSVHLDMAQRQYTRCCRILGTEGTIEWDGVSHGVRLYSAQTNVWKELHASKSVERNDMYVAELTHFLSSVRDHSKVAVSGEDGLRVLQMAIAVKQSSQDHLVVELEEIR